MKQSELRRLIREEVRKTLNESYEIPAGVEGQQFVEALKKLLPELRKKVDEAASQVKVTYIEDDYVTKKHSAGMELKVQYVGIKQSNAYANTYNSLLWRLDLLQSGVARGEPNTQQEQEIRTMLSKLK